MSNKSHSKLVESSNNSVNNANQLRTISLEDSMNDIKSMGFFTGRKTKIKTDLSNSKAITEFTEKKNTLLLDYLVHDLLDQADNAKKELYLNLMLTQGEVLRELEELQSESLVELNAAQMEMRMGVYESVNEILKDMETRLGEYDEEILSSEKQRLLNERFKLLEKTDQHYQDTKDKYLALYKNILDKAIKNSSVDKP